MKEKILIFSFIFFENVSAFASIPLHPILDPDFQYEIDILTESQLTHNNTFELLVDSQASLHKKIEMVQKAQHSIFLSSMIFVSYLDSLTSELVQALIDKAKKNIPVYMIMDEFSSYLDINLFKRLEKNGIHIAYFNPTFEMDPIPFNVRMHEKIMVVDYRKAVVGGQNMYDERYTILHKLLKTNALNWRDTDIYVEGPLAQDIEHHLFDFWNRIPQSKRIKLPPSEARTLDITRMKDNGEARFLYNEPYLGSKFINRYYLKLIQSAQKEIIWQGNQVVLTKEFEMALKEAARRGVQVTLMTNSFSTSWWQPFWYQYLFTKGYLPFRNSQVRLQLYKTRYNHSKVFYIDGVAASIGSYNHDEFSLNQDAESTIVVYDPKTIEVIYHQILEDLKDTEELIFPF